MKSITEVMEDIVKPYIDTQNQALTNYTADTGVKNLHDVSGSEISGVYGVTVTRLSKGYKLESTMSGSWSHAYFSQKLEKNTDYVLTTDITFSSGLGAIYIYGKVTGGSNVEIKHIDNINASGSKTIEFNSGNYDEYQIYLSITGTPSATGNITFDNFMVRDATITDPTYQPYAKTNVELTQDVSDVLPIVGDAIEITTTESFANLKNGITYKFSTSDTGNPFSGYNVAVKVAKVASTSGVQIAYKVVSSANTELDLLAIRPCLGGTYGAWRKFSGVIPA